MDRLKKILYVAKKELPKEKRFHKEIMKLAKQTNNTRAVYSGMRNHLSRNKLTNLGKNFASANDEILDAFDSVYTHVDRVIEQILKVKQFDREGISYGYMHEPDRELSHAYDILEITEGLVRYLFMDVAKHVKKSAKNMGEDVTKEFEWVSRNRDLVLCAKRLVELIEDYLE